MGRTGKRTSSPRRAQFLTDVGTGRSPTSRGSRPICDDFRSRGLRRRFGPSWVASIVNAVGKSQFWNSTAIFVMWDDWGGLYDHVPPPSSSTTTGLGFRVPLLMISPYAKKDYVSHVAYETASVLTFAEDVFGLPRLAAADARATSPAADCFDFSQPPRAFVPIGKIQHVVIIIQENRSFNDLFMVIRERRRQPFGYNSYGQKITLKPIGLETTWDIDHSSKSFFAACNGPGQHPRHELPDERLQQRGSRMRAGRPPCPIQASDSTRTYRTRKTSRTLRWRSNTCWPTKCSLPISMGAVLSRTSTSFPPKRDRRSTIRTVPGVVPAVRAKGSIQSGRSAISRRRTKSSVGIPRRWATNSTVPVFRGRFTPSTDQRRSVVIWSAYQAINHIYNGPDWKNGHHHSPAQFLTDISNGNLRAVSWVTPTGANSDHAAGLQDRPVVGRFGRKCLGKSKYWKSTAIFIFWDDYGGWYDPVAPAYVDYDGLGLRLPMLIVSPYAKKGYVTHVNYEHGSILKFTEDVRVGAAVGERQRATSPTDAFDFTQAPRKFVKNPGAL